MSSKKATEQKNSLPRNEQEENHAEQDFSAVGILIDIEEFDNEPEIEPEKGGKPKRDSDFDHEQVILVIPPKLKTNNVALSPTPAPKGNNVVPTPSPAPKSNNVVSPPPRWTDKANTEKSNPKNMYPLPKTTGNHALLPPSNYDSAKPDIIIGEIDRDEAKMVYENLLGIGQSVLDWLGAADRHISSNYNPTSLTLSLNSKRTDAQAFEKQIVSIETEYNRLKRDIQPLQDSHPETYGWAWASQAVHYFNTEVQIKLDIHPKIFSSKANFTADRTENKNKFRRSLNTKEDEEMPSSSTRTPNTVKKPNSPSPDPVSCKNRTCRDTGVALKSCSIGLHDRLHNLEIAFKNHKGNFANVVAELKACLEYCHSSFADDSDEELRNRIIALFKIVALHKAALEDWKQELKRNHKSNK